MNNLKVTSKKIFAILLLSVFLLAMLPAVSATSIDYSNKDMTVHIKDTILFGLINIGEQGTMELKSHKSVTEIKHVSLGNQVTMYYDSNFGQAHKDALGEVSFIDMKTGNEVQRDWRYVYWVEEEYEIPIYDYPIETLSNGTKIYNTIQTGTETLTRGEWKDYNSKDIPKGQLRIGIMVEVREGDYIDGIWEIQGKKIKKHVTWQDSISLDAVSNGGATATSLTYAHTCTGSNRILFVGVGIESGNDWITGVTYDGSAMILVDKIVNAPNNNEWIYMYYLIAPSTGANNVVISSSDSVHIDGVSVSYTGANQDNQPDNFTTNKENGGGTMTTTLTTVADNSWVISVCQRDAAAPTPSTGVTLRATNANTLIGDSNEPKTPVGDYDMTWTGSSNLETVQASFKPLFGITTILNSPIDYYNSTSSTIFFNGTISGLIPINVSLIIDGTYNETDTSGVLGVYNFTKILSEGDHTWNMKSCITTFCANGTERTLTIDSTPPTMNITSPSETSYNYLTDGTNFTLNFTASDNINLDTCWSNYNNTNTTIACSNNTLSSTNLTINNFTSLRMYANDTAGNLAYDSVTWTYTLFDFLNYTYDASTTEVSSATISGRFQTSSAISSSYLQYNNTNYSASITSLGGNIYTLSSTIITPSVTSNSNITWFFWVNGLNATAYNQTVINILLDDCSSYTFPVVNYTLVDELTQININNTNSTIESLIILKIITGGEVITFNKTFNGTVTASICSETNLNTSSLRLWEQSRYGSTNYVYEQHNLQNVSMTSLPNEITLRDLPSTSATTFRIKYRSSTFLPIANAVVNIQRKYIGEGIYKTIESPLTDTSGETSASLDLNSVLYRIIVSKDGTTLATFENPAVACDNLLTGDCSITINERDTVNLINNYDIINDFNYGLYQDNRTITLTFEIPSGTNRLVNLFVNQSTILGNKTSCNQTVFASSGQLQCDIAEALGDVSLVVEVSADNILIRRASAKILEDRSEYFGNDNIVLTFFLVLSLVLLMVSSPITVLIGLVIGLIASSLMLFLNAGDIFGVAPVLTYVIIIVILLIIKISKRES